MTALRTSPSGGESPTWFLTRGGSPGADAPMLCYEDGDPADFSTDTTALLDFGDSVGNIDSNSTAFGSGSGSGGGSGGGVGGDGSGDFNDGFYYDDLAEGARAAGKRRSRRRKRLTLDGDGGGGGNIGGYCSWFTSYIWPLLVPPGKLTTFRAVYVP